MNKAAHAYFSTQVGTTTQGDLLLMLYDGAVKFLNQAKDKIAERDFAAKGILLSKAIDVISELDASLNPQKGGDLADNLHKLYFYCNTRLLNANLKMDVSYVDEVIKILGGLREAFAQVAALGAPQPDTPPDRQGPSARGVASPMGAAGAAGGAGAAMRAGAGYAAAAAQQHPAAQSPRPGANVYPLMPPAAGGPHPAQGGARPMAGANAYRRMSERKGE